MVIFCPFQVSPSSTIVKHYSDFFTTIFFYFKKYILMKSFSSNVLYKVS
jgi:hypothetical protein